LVFEIFKTFIQRLEAANGTDRIKVEGQMDAQGNLILPTRAVYFVDDEGTLHESASTDGNFLTRNWPSGSIVEVIGGFEKTVGGGTGSLLITPTAGDEAFLMYGNITQGAVVSGGGPPVPIWASTASIMSLLADVNMAANDIMYIPTAFADAAVAVGAPNGTPTIHQLMFAEDHALQIAVAGMGIGEMFGVQLAFRSLAGNVPEVVPIGGTFA